MTLVTGSGTGRGRGSIEHFAVSGVTAVLRARSVCRSRHCSQQKERDGEGLEQEAHHAGRERSRLSLALAAEVNCGELRCRRVAEAEITQRRQKSGVYSNFKFQFFTVSQFFSFS